MLWGCFIVTGAVNLIKMEGIMRKEGYVKVLKENSSSQQQNWLSAVASDTKEPKAYVAPGKEPPSGRLNVVDWPANSFDLNSTENLWSKLKTKVSARRPSKNREMLLMSKQVVSVTLQSRAETT